MKKLVLILVLAASIAVAQPPAATSAPKLSKDQQAEILRAQRFAVQIDAAMSSAALEFSKLQTVQKQANAKLVEVLDRGSKACGAGYHVDPDTVECAVDGTPSAAEVKAKRDQALAALKSALDGAAKACGPGTHLDVGKTSCVADVTPGH